MSTLIFVEFTNLQYELTHAILKSSKDTAPAGNAFPSRPVARTDSRPALHNLKSNRMKGKKNNEHNEPSDALIEWILENDIQEIKLNRNEPHGIRIAGGNAAANGGVATTGTASKGHSIRYKCLCCGQLARTTKKARLICGDCMLPMLES